MYKQKKESVIFYQRKEIRHISFIEILMACFGVYGLVMIYKDSIHSSGILYLLFSTVIILARFIAPMFQKQYNAQITNKEVLLDNVDLKTIYVSINSITEYKAINSSTVSISGESKGEKYSYNILLDEEDITFFLKCIEQKKVDYLNVVRKSIDKSSEL